MLEVSLSGVEKYYGANRVLKGITFQVLRGEKVGIVGRNGTGKTTLFKIIAGIENCDEGSISISKGSQIGCLEQIPNYPKGYRVIDVLNMAFHYELNIQSILRELEEKMSYTKGEELNSMIQRYGELQNIFESKGGYKIEEKLSRLCDGLGLDKKFLNMKFKDLSGGEKTTVLLGKILLEEPDILLLDEPTNHLDMESIEWLESFLLEYRGTVIIISHDRYFLDKVINKVIEIERGKANTYMGNYSYYVEEKEKLYLEELKRYEDQQKKIKSMEESIKRLKDWADRGGNEKFFRRAFSMEKRLEKMDKIDRPIVDNDNMKLNFSVQERSGQDVILADGLYKKVGKKVLFNDLNFSLKYSERVALVGKNGSGKTTLIKIILGEAFSDKGEVKIGSKVKIGYLQQNIYFNNEESTVLDIFREEYICTEGDARNILSKFLFYGEDVFKKVKNLSGGERARLRICQLMYKDVNTLILDEPTNHLDIMSREMLEETLLQFQGTIMFISHDRYFINRLANKVLELSNRKLISYLGNYDYYREKKLSQKKSERADKKTSYNHNKADNNLKNGRKNVVDKSKARKIKEIEDEIEKYENLIANKEIEININTTNFSKLNSLYKEKIELEDRLDKILEQWIMLNE
ncbi:ABC-F type ribosomal protection protein [Clostridium sp. D2Q-14]|uniref:ribosomal protection-like ABC-F family protein n=1 Tax=Anaeromonas gelatinilytica TaxID=2683194 RepID=UPI00193AF7B7|nr:ABC-F type ribosomal protection protein [Anaeromonas gelatinilytica]MBS4536370.1 ABC-F type ribosomal protection protein [Anaeromonas gelatinilytica]